MFSLPFWHTVALFALFSLLCLIFGRRVLWRFSLSLSFSSRLALQYVVGFGVILYLSLFLGLLGWFTFPKLTLLFVFFLAVFARDIPRVFRDVASAIRALLGLWKIDCFSAIFVFLALFLGFFNFLAAFAPPTARDAISYHIPEAQRILSLEKIVFPLGDHPFYGNLPVLMEVGYALGMLFSGFALAQLFHYAFFLAFVCFVFGWMRRHFGLRTASIAVFTLFFLHDLVTTAISLNIDTAHMVLEVMGFLLVLDFVLTKERNFLKVSGMIFGLALSIKYSPLVSACLAGLVVFCASLTNRKTLLKNILAFSVPLLLVAGFWYGKNLLLFGNPFYPLYFGHRGYDEVAFQSLMQAIQDFRVPRTLVNFLLFPKIFYFRYPPFLALFDIPQATLVFASFLLLPIVLFLRRRRKLLLLMLGFVLVYSAYWFFFATHQLRFLDVSNIVLVLLAVISLTSLPWKKIFPFLFLAVFLVGLFLFRSGLVRATANGIFVGVERYVFHVREVEYALGIINKASYLDDSLDCGFDAAYWLEQNNLPGAVLDNWSVWHNHHFRFYVTKNSYLSLPENVALDALPAFVNANNVRYVYFNEESKQDFAMTSSVTGKAYYDARITQEEALLRDAKLVYTYETCVLYQLP